jgi:hypothetical protein
MAIPPSTKYTVGMAGIGDPLPAKATVTDWEKVAAAPAVSVTVNSVVKLFAD